MIIEKIKKDLYQKGISNRKLATELNISHTSINDMLGGRRDFEFSIFSGILMYLYPDKQHWRHEQIDQFCIENDRKDNLPLVLEYANLKGELVLMKRLIEKGEMSNVELIQELAQVYKLLYIRNAELVSKEEYHQKVRELMGTLRSTSIEVEILLEFALIYAYLDLGDFKLVHEYTQRLNNLIPTVKNEYCRYAYEIRKNEMLASCLHKDNKVEYSREICLKIANDKRNDFPLTKAIAYGIIGETYILTDFEKSDYYLRQSLLYVENPYNKKMEYRYQKIKNTLDFLYIHWKKNLDNINPLNPEEQAYLYIQRGEIDRAIEKLMEIREKSTNTSPFWMYYWGLATGDKEMLKQSALEFVRTQNAYYAKLPLDEL